VFWVFEFVSSFDIRISDFDFSVSGYHPILNWRRQQTALCQQPGEITDFVDLFQISEDLDDLVRLLG